MKNTSQLKLWVTLGITGHISIKRSSLENWFTLGKVGNTWKNGSNL